MARNLIQDSIVASMRGRKQGGLGSYVYDFERMSNTMATCRCVKHASRTTRNRTSISVVVFLKHQRYLLVACCAALCWPPAGSADFLRNLVGSLRRDSYTQFDV